MNYKLELKQIVEFPRCRIYRDFIQTLITTKWYANGAYTPPANGGQYQAPPNGTGQPQSSYPPQGSYTGMPNYGGMPGSQPTDGFQNVPEQMASQLPY